MAWISEVQGSKDRYVALFNLSKKETAVSVLFSSLGLKGKIKVRDLWQKNNIGSFTKTYSQKINAHGSVLLRLSME